MQTSARPAATACGASARCTGASRESAERVSASMLRRGGGEPTSTDAPGEGEEDREERPKEREVG
eukprot:scaffold78311_cov33-Tisochrysis_lutea.AAC.4